MGLTVGCGAVVQWYSDVDGTAVSAGGRVSRYDNEERWELTMLLDIKDCRLDKLNKSRETE